MQIFKKRKEKLSGKTGRDVVKEKIDIPEGYYTKCKSCDSTLHNDDVEKNDFICSECGEYFRVSAVSRIKMTVDEFLEFDEVIQAKNPLDFPDYEKKLTTLESKTGNKEAVITGLAKIEEQQFILAVMDSYFLMGSMGSVVGEKITRAFEFALNRKLPIVVFTASGGARMQEGIMSLMQMAKTSAAVKKHSDKGLLYVTVLTDPTTGGVTASFASLGDIIISEPNALIGFAGPRVIKQTIKQDLPDGFQRAEFLFEKGFVDSIVKRDEMKQTLHRILEMHSKEARHVRDE